MKEEVPSKTNLEVIFYFKENEYSIFGSEGNIGKS